MPWALGPRDDAGAPLGKIGGRLDRAYRNFLETFPFFAAAVLLAHALDKSTSTSVLGAQIYIWARVLYIPAYVFAIPFVRTLIWVAGLAGIAMVMLAGLAGNVGTSTVAQAQATRTWVSGVADGERIVQRTPLHADATLPLTSPKPTR
jgi:uncharacterized MAPEG superfamily protein